jgi:hypothetical protein
MYVTSEFVSISKLSQILRYFADTCAEIFLDVTFDVRLCKL